MNTFISLLRAVNVAGKTIRMADVKTLYEGMGFANVRTYLQSGNVVFDSSEADGGALSAAIEGQLVHSLGVSAAVLNHAAQEWQRIVNMNPFLHGRMEDPAWLHVTFLKGTPLISRLTALKVPEGETDEFRVGEKEIYLFCPNGYGRTKLSNTFFERKLDLTATTRNWNTVMALLSMANEGK
jgi:uncharacterized protein (DUF1697 family)